jgi:hypothetical protein
MSIKNAAKYTEQLDKIAEEIQNMGPEMAPMALMIDRVSDVIEGKKDASTLKFDADEAKYMANRFNNKVQQRESDEPFMDTFNDNDFEQVKREKANPKPVKVAYQKVM